MFLQHFTNPYTQTLYPEGSPFFTPNGCTGARLKKNLTHINAVFADWDFKPKAGEPTGSAKPDYKQFMLDLDGLPEPTFVVESGNGWHLYWLLEESVVVTDENRDELIKQVEGIHNYIHTNYGSDSGAMDVLRLMRLPGHAHRKQPDHPVMVTVIEDNNDTRYTFDELLNAMPPVYKEVVEYEAGDGDDYDIRQVAIDVWAEKGDVVTFDTLGRMVWNGQPTATFIGREGKGNYIATTSDEFPYKGNATTYVAGVLGITTKDAYKWLIAKYGELKKDEPKCESRETYLIHLAQGKWDNEDWVKELKKKESDYFLHYFEWFAIKYPHLKFEDGKRQTFWDYNASTGVYEQLTDVTVIGLVISLLREDGLDKYTTETNAKRVIINFMADRTRAVTLDSFVVSSPWLHVENGWLNLKNRQLEKHTPKRLSLFKMDVAYDPNATCPLYDKFLDVDVQMSKDQVRVIDQFSGYILTDSIKQHTSLFLEGRKGCGKSMLMEIWMNLLGRKAVSLQLTSLQNGGERFIGQTLAHKNLVWFDEANPRTSNINEFFQNLITGEKIRIERKGIQGDDYVRNTMKVVLSLNEMPDHMPVGMDRRYRHIVFHRSFYEEGISDPDYKEKVLTNERSGVLNRMLRGLDDLEKMGRMTMIAGEEERKREYTLTSDDFSSFLEEHFEPVNDNETRYTFKQMRDAFVVEYPKGYNKQLTVRGFNKKLFSTRLPEFKNIRQGKIGAIRGYKGIKLKAGHEFPVNEFEPITVATEL